MENHPPHHYFDPEQDEAKLAEALKNPAAKLWYEKLLLAKSIKKFRKKAGMTQKDFAQKLRTSQSAVARIESGKQNISLPTLVRIAHILGRKLHIKIL